MVAATAGGVAAVVAAEAGAGGLSIMAGAVSGIAAGALAEVLAERRDGEGSGGPDDHHPRPPEMPETPA